jgi:hypothetical protein
MGFEFLFGFEEVFKNQFPQGFIKEIQVFNVLEACSAFIAAGCGILKGGFIAVDEGKIADLHEPLYGVGDIRNGKPFFVL